MPYQMPNVSADDAKGFLGSLFDLSFTNFITTKLIKVLYVLGMILAALTALGMLFSGLAALFSGTAGGIVSAIVGVVLSPLVFLVMVIYMRVGLEVIITIFRATEHLAEIARQTRR